MNLKNTKNGFTLAELMLVIWITIFLLGIAVSGMIRSQRTFAFNNAYLQMNSIVREARSWAVTGKAQPDYTDYDNDDCYDGTVVVHLVGCANPAVPDYVTPANYGIHFDKDNNKMIVFADLHPGKTGGQVEGQFDDPDDPGPAVAIGQYVANKDIKLVEYDLDPALEFIYTPASTDGTYTVMYTPLFADTSFYENPPPAADIFFIYGIKETRTDPLKRCSAIHPVSGVPEASSAAIGTDDDCDLL